MQCKTHKYSLFLYTFQNQKVLFLNTYNNKLSLHFWESRFKFLYLNKYNPFFQFFRIEKMGFFF